MSESKSICDDCNNGHKNSDKKPCPTCFSWVDGYLDAKNYEPKKD